jgi:glycosyltransferase involved in cell wall biosynthesis
MRIIGEVTEVAPHLDAARLLVVPLREGAGTRLKILEALAYGVPVVSTTIGCEGLGLQTEREIIVADAATQFAHAIDRVLEDDALCEQLALAGRSAVEARFDWAEIGATADRILQAVATENRVHTKPAISRSSPT